MARRSSRRGAFEDLTDIASRLPWQASLGLAVVSFVVLHAIAGMDVGATGPMKNIGALAGRQMFKSIAFVMQFAVPLALIAGAIMSAVHQRRRRELVEAAARDDSGDPLLTMTWREFEALVEESFRLRGYAVKRLGGDGTDGGVDLELRRGTELVLVQCKHWRAQKVTVQVARELYGVMAARGAASGIVVSSGSFTRDAAEFAQGRNLRLITGEELSALVREASNAKPRTAPASSSQHLSGATGGCPVCGSPMVKRQAKRGANAGGVFYGCSKYPVCRGVRSI